EAGARGGGGGEPRLRRGARGRRRRSRQGGEALAGSAGQAGEERGAARLGARGRQSSEAVRRRQPRDRELRALPQGSPGQENALLRGRGGGRGLPRLPPGEVRRPRRRVPGLGGPETTQ